MSTGLVCEGVGGEGVRVRAEKSTRAGPIDVTSLLYLHPQHDSTIYMPMWQKQSWEVEYFSREGQ